MVSSEAILTERYQQLLTTPAKMEDLDPMVCPDHQRTRESIESKLWQPRNMSDLAESLQRLLITLPPTGHHRRSPRIGCQNDHAASLNRLIKYCSPSNYRRVLKDPVYAVLNLWEIVLCTPGMLQHHAGSAGLDKGFSFILYAARKGNYKMLKSMLCEVVLSRMIKKLAASNTSTASLEFVRLRCRMVHALTLREWLEKYNTRADGPAVDLDSLFSILASHARRSRKNVITQRYTFGSIVRRVRTMIADDADAGWLREQVMRAMDSLESHVCPKPVPPVRKPPKHHKKPPRPSLNFDEYGVGCDGDTLDENHDDEFSSDDGRSTPSERSNSPQNTSNAQIADHFTASPHSVLAGDPRTKETANDGESPEHVPHREYEMEACDDITINSWVVDMTAKDDASSHLEWDLLSNFSADIDEMSFQSVVASEQEPRRTGLSYSQALKSGQALTMMSIPESKTLRAPETHIKSSVSLKKKLEADNGDDIEFLLFDAESIRDGVKRRHAKHKNGSTARRWSP
jgi:hypothetical protein